MIGLETAEASKQYSTYKFIEIVCTERNCAADATTTVNASGSQETLTTSLWARRESAQADNTLRVAGFKEASKGDGWNGDHGV
jgi:hypothetical protein